MYRNIFIDLDNTLWDFSTNSKNVLSVLFYKYGLDKYFEDFSEYFKIYSGHNNFLWEEYALNKISKEYHIISIDDTYTWPNPVNVQWEGIIGFQSYLDWGHFRGEWEIIEKV